MRFAVLASIAVLAAACGDDNDTLECSGSSDCEQGGVAGECLPSPVSSKSWCAFADPACDSTDRWGLLAGDGLAGECVAASQVDAGIDASTPDAAVTDASVDASVPDASPAPDTLPFDAGGDVDMVLVPSGPFSMGCNFGDCSIDPGESPYHEVALAAFEIDIHEVTKGAYNECVAAGVCSPPPATGGDVSYPVTQVSWQDAFIYCAWAGKRLPTEAEWEKACRGDDGRGYPWGNSAPDSTKATDGARSVGSLPVGPSPFGVLGMADNAAEWVGDWYSATYYSASPTTDPPGPATGTERVIRSLGLSGTANFYKRCSYRQQHGEPTSRPIATGFRCARD